MCKFTRFSLVPVKRLGRNEMKKLWSATRDVLTGAAVALPGDGAFQGGAVAQRTAIASAGDDFGAVIWYDTA